MVGILSIIIKALTEIWILCWPSAAKDTSPHHPRYIGKDRLCRSSENERASGNATNNSALQKQTMRSMRLQDENSVLSAMLLGMSMIARGERSVYLLQTSLKRKTDHYKNNHSSLHLVYADLHSCWTDWSWCIISTSAYSNHG